MLENRVMTEAEMSMAKATGARVVTIAKEQDPNFWLEVNEIRALREKMNQLTAPLNVSHTLPLGWSLDDDLRIVTQLVELKRKQLYELELVLDRLNRKIADLGVDPKELG